MQAFCILVPHQKELRNSVRKTTATGLKNKRNMIGNKQKLDNSQLKTFRYFSFAGKNCRELFKYFQSL